jgi:acyl carrier protein
MDEIMRQIKSFIINNFMYGAGSQLKENTSFIDSGIIDSTGILELVTFLEASFHITIESDEIVPENLGSIANIISYVKRKCADHVDSGR